VKNRALWWNLPGLIVVLLLNGFAGLVAYARYAKCDPLSAGYITKNDQVSSVVEIQQNLKMLFLQILPYYVVQNFGHIPGFVGLFVAAIYSGAMRFHCNLMFQLCILRFQQFLAQFHQVSIPWLQFSSKTYLNHF